MNILVENNMLKYIMNFTCIYSMCTVTCVYNIRQSNQLKTGADLGFLKGDDENRHSYFFFPTWCAFSIKVAIVMERVQSSLIVL